MNPAPAASPVVEIERRLSWRAVPVLLFLAALIALTAVAALTLMMRPRVIEGLPDDPLALEAREKLAGHVALGFDGLRFRAALLGEADPRRSLCAVDPNLAAESEALLQKAARRLPLDPRVHAAQGHLDLARRRFASAEQLYRHALDLHAHLPEARLGLGVALAEQALIEGDLLRARALNLEAIAQFAAVEPGAAEYDDALYDRAWLLGRVGRRAEALGRAGEYLARDAAGPWADRLRLELGIAR